MNHTETHLPCGVDLEDLMRQVFEGAEPVDPDHQRSCRHCQGALRRLRAVADDVHGLASQPVAVPRTLFAAVMAKVRARPALVTVDVKATGTTLVADRVIAEVAERAALWVDGVDYASVIASEERPAGVVGLRVRLIVAYGPALPPIAAEVQRVISRDVIEISGATPRSVDVRIDDLT